MENIVGKRFGKLVILESFLEKTKGNYVTGRVRCNCDCGTNNFITYRSAVIRPNGGTKSCGCLAASRRINLVGQRFGLLVVTKRAKTLNKNNKYISVWLCKCDCGSIVTIPTYSLIGKGNKTKSCKCAWKRTGNKSPLFKGIGEISGNYLTRLKRRDLKIEVTLEQIWNLFLKQNRKCALSGLEIDFGDQSVIVSKRKQTASLDRIDSSKDYTIDNIQWVHRDINWMKSDYDDDYYIKMCKIVANHNKNHE